MQRMPLTKRLDANLGYICNNNCLFCYFKSRKNERFNISTEKAKKLFSSIKKLGIDTLEITGGEVTLRDDFFDLIMFAKKNLKFKKITVITNGTKFCEETFTDKAVAYGIDDVLVSVHGPDARLHDLLTDRPGAFNQAVQAIKNVLKLGVSCRINTVVSALNYAYVSDIAELVFNLGIKKINYIYFSPLDDALNTPADLWVRYSQTSPFIKAMIEAYKDKFETISIKVIPFCFLDRYEEYITDFFQNIYDPYEWDFYNRVRIRRDVFQRDLAVLIGFLFFMDIRHMLKTGWRKSLYESIMHTQAFRECIKPAVCRQCKFDLICPGIWKAYAKRFGVGELKAVSGEKIEDIDSVLQKRFAGYYSK